jgi:flagellin-specific chaperone FliS
MNHVIPDYARSAYAAAQTQAMSREQVLLQIYDFAIAGCVARDTRKASAALVELIAALDFNYEEIAGGLYRLYEYSLREVKAQRFDSAHTILSGLRDAWREAFSVSGAMVGTAG